MRIKCESCGEEHHFKPSTTGNILVCEGCGHAQVVAGFLGEVMPQQPVIERPDDDDEKVLID
jgi:hypothetical protein